MSTASIPEVTQFTTNPPGVLSVDVNGKVILVEDQGSGIVSACGGSAGVANYLTKFTSTTNICSTSVWENSTPDRNVGIGTASPFYKLHNSGNAMFTLNVLAAPCSSYNSSSHPLSVVSNLGAGGPAGIAVFSTGSATAPNDELNIYVDGNGQTTFRSLYHNTDFMSLPYSASMLGLVPGARAVVMKNNFTTIPGQPASGLAKLYVEAQSSNPSHNYAVWANNTNTNYSPGDPVAAIRCETNTVRTSLTDVNIGLDAQAEGAYAFNNAVVGYAIGANATAWNRGAYFKAQNGTTSVGVEAEASGSSITNIAGAFLANGLSVPNYGLKGTAVNGSVNIGIYGYTAGTSTSSNNYAIYGITAQSPSSCTTGTCTQAAGYFNGDVYTTSASYLISDSTLKKNINPLQNSSLILSQITTFTYQFDTSKTHGMNVPEDDQIGFLSQQIQPILPGLVKETANPETLDSLGTVIHPKINYLAINYNGIIPLLVAGHNEQSYLIDSLTSRLANLEAIVNSCCGNVSKSGVQLFDNNNKPMIELKNIHTIILRQNVPNPFAEETDISYNLPLSVTSAKIIIFDKSGTVLKTIEINERGESTLHVYAPDISNGTYSYSLIADGKVIDSKTMVKTK